jgi:hypothetical protein
VLLGWAVKRTSQGGRNKAGFDLACALRDNGFSIGEAEAVVRQFQATVESDSHPYTIDEALASLASAYAGASRGPWRRQERTAEGFRLSQPTCKEEAPSYHGNGDKRNPPLYPAQLIKPLEKPPPPTACKRNPAHYLTHATKPLARTVRHACHGNGCPICVRRNAWRYGIHIAKKLLAAHEKGLTLATAEIEAAGWSGLRKAITRLKANYARMELPAEALGLVIACECTVLPPPFATASLEEAGAFTGRCLVTLKPTPKEEPTSAQGGNPLVGKATKTVRRRTDTLSKGWKLDKPPRAEVWRFHDRISCRETAPVLDLLRRYGLMPVNVEEDGSTGGTSPRAWLVQWEIPEDWPSETRGGFERDLLDLSK